MDRYDVLVIGAGPAGVTAALRASELGAKVGLVERKWMGGTCSNDGCVPTRVLAKTARLLRETEHFGNYGLRGQRPRLDFAKLIDYTRGIVQATLEKKQIDHHLDKAKVKVFGKAGPVRFLDDHTLSLGNGGSLRGEKIIICAGGHSRRISFPGSDLPGILTHSDVWGLKKMPRSVAVVGAAATGCQVASMLNAFGAQVWLLEVAPRILTIEDPIISDVVTESFRRNGIQVTTGMKGLDRIERGESKGQLKLWYTHQDQQHSVAVDAVLLAVGWVGNVEDLNLAAAGVKAERGYIVVNDQLQTSVPHILAAGDITGRVMLVQTANYDGRLAAENAVLGKGHSYVHRIVPHGGFTDPDYGGVGFTEEQARAKE
ncbi:MAG TPA: NAD(P)/FAD-dependent oxidoreductase, partial [Candidatus Acidoferrum sp.]|nr:NAD(P)/FAD-dependent oxidoreductase [Candidatus Acidoferrum sp.]